MQMLVRLDLKVNDVSSKCEQTARRYKVLI
jgi:hypothetical protein